MQRKNMNPVDRGLRLRHLSMLAAMVWAGEAVSATVEKYVRNSTELIGAFAAADADPTNLHKLTLEWRRDGNGNTITWEAPPRR